jgi:hypothetical protein
MYYTLDNLGERTAADRYDGDGVTITSTNGVPNPPISSLLRTHINDFYDDQGRVISNKPLVSTRPTAQFLPTA